MSLDMPWWLMLTVAWFNGHPMVVDVTGWSGSLPSNKWVDEHIPTASHYSGHCWDVNRQGYSVVTLHHICFYSGKILKNKRTAEHGGSGFPSMAAGAVLESSGDRLPRIPEVHSTSVKNRCKLHVGLLVNWATGTLPLITTINIKCSRYSKGSSTRRFGLCVHQFWWRC